MAKAGRKLMQERLSRWRPLGSFGYPAHACHGQLMAMFQARRLPLLARYFARPVLDEKLKTISYVHDGPGTIRRPDQLSGDERSAALQHIGEVHASLNRLLADLRAQGAGPSTEPLILMLEQAQLQHG